MANLDQFGYGIEKLDESQKVAKQLASDHMLIWNKLVENKGPNELKKDQLNPDARLMELFKNESFKTFLEAKTLDAKMVALRDAGIVNNDIIKDEDLARTLMETISYSLTEDPNVQPKKPSENSLMPDQMPVPDSARQTKEPFLTLTRTGDGLIDKVFPDLKY